MHTLQQPKARTVERVILVTVAIILQSALHLISVKQTKPAKIGGLQTNSWYTAVAYNDIAPLLA